MQRDQLIHLIRASTAIINDWQIIIVGSQALHGQHPTNLPDEVLLLDKAELLPIGDSYYKTKLISVSRKIEMINGTFGEGTWFHSHFGICAQGVSEDELTLPKGSRDRLKEIDCNGVTGLCLDQYDLLISLFVAGRESDLELCSAVVKANPIDKGTLLERLGITDCTPGYRKVVGERIERNFSNV